MQNEIQGTHLIEATNPEQFQEKLDNFFLSVKKDGHVKVVDVKYQYSSETQDSVEVFSALILLG